VVPFTLDRLDSRGRVVRLGPSLDAILSRHNYPAPVARLLGEAVVLAALIGSSLKFEGKFHPADPDRWSGEPDGRRFRRPRRLRGYARFDADAVMQAIERGEIPLPAARQGATWP
jgi:molecular chaperone Hsp33